MPKKSAYGTSIQFKIIKSIFNRSCSPQEAKIQLHLEVAKSKPSEALFITDPKLWKTTKITQDIVYDTKFNQLKLV